MKKIILCFALVLLLVNLAACGKKGNTEAAASVATDAAPAATDAAAQGETSATGSKETYPREKADQGTQTSATEATEKATEAATEATTSYTLPGDGQRLPDMPIE